MPRKMTKALEETAAAWLFAWILVAAIIGTILGGAAWLAWRHL